MERMRILLDAKDLINLVEHNTPVPLAEFVNWLKERNARLVLTAMNVGELVTPLKRGRDFLGIRVLLQAIERSPVSYLRETYIILQELQSALQAFQDATEFRMPDPYVVRWDEVIQAPGHSVAQMYVNYRLDEMIYTLWKGNALPDFARSTKTLNALFQSDRNLAKAAHLSLKKNFVETVKRHLHQHKIEVSISEAERLGLWIYSDPTRCPGLRLHYDAFHELERNVNEIALSGDIPDFAHIAAIPYVDYITVDRRIAHYCRTVGRKLRARSPAIKYEGRIFESLQKLLADSGTSKDPRGSKS
jgi:hypothetical protein